jgi:hypothetical protein
MVSDRFIGGVAMVCSFVAVLQTIRTGRVFATGIKGRQKVTRAKQPRLYWINTFFLIGLFFLGLMLFLEMAH